MRSELDDIRKLMARELPWGPHGFIRGISADADREGWAESLTSDLAEGDDLRFRFRQASGEAVGVFARRLPWDSDFFGYGIARLDGVFPLAPPLYRPGDDFAPAIHHLIELARERDVRYLLAAADPRDLATLRALGAAGFSLIETRAYYHMPIIDYAHPERFSVRAARTEDIPALGNAAREMVNPFDRFHSDPFIAREDADRLMYRWVEASIADGFADITIVPDVGRPTAFCTVKYHRDQWERLGLKLAQPVFSAVSPEFKGWYRKIISEVNYHLRSIGAEHSYLITQITNVSVTWVWESLGYRFGKGEHVFRLVL